MRSGARRWLMAVLCLTSGVAACDGPMGPAGNANVQSGTQALVSADWLWNDSWILETGIGSTTGWFTRYADISTPLITEDIVNNGTVLVYFKSSVEPVQGQAGWTSLPFTFLEFGNQFYYNFRYKYEVGKIRLHYFWSPNGSSGTVPDGLNTYTLPDYTFKYVIIAGTT